VTVTRTIAGLLHEAAGKLRRAGIDDAELEAEVLLRHALALNDDRAQLFARLRETADISAVTSYRGFVRRRLAHEPAAYIIGSREFFGLKLECSPVALIPRPETELLVELGLEWLARRDRPARPLVVDVGTGNGALAVALAAHAPTARVVAIDTSSAALRLAQRNAARHAVDDRVRCLRGDLLGPLGRPADLVVANLPYVSEPDWHALPDEIRRHEPRSALVGGPDGTETIARLLEQAPAHLAARSLLLCECGDRQGDALRAEAALNFPGARIDVRQDLAGLDRVLRVEL
jgi:release factor glutamine methyltransferase